MRKLHLLLIMLACCLSGNVRAEVYSGTCGFGTPKNITWRLDTETGEIRFSGYGEMNSYTSASVTPTYRILPPWYPYKKYIKSIIFSSGITNISSWAFSECPSLSEISISNTIRSIGNSAFYNCDSLIEIHIGENIKYVDDHAFSNCGSLKSVEITGENVKYVGNYAFSNCDSLKSVEIRSATSIGRSAFKACYSLTKIHIGENVKSIGGYAFSDCDSLKSVEIESSKTIIGYRAFNGCRKIPFPLLTNDGKKLVKESYQYSGHYTLSPNIQYIESSAFEGCNKITSIDIPNSVTSIGAYAFSGCGGLTSITLPESITTIGNRAFGECRQLQSINIPNTIDSINAKTFENCTKLSHISIPESVVSIGDSAFLKCSKLEKLHIPNSVEQIGVGALDCGIVELTIPFIGVSRTSEKHPCLAIFSRIGNSWDGFHYQFPITLKKLTLTDLHKCNNSGEQYEKKTIYNSWETSIESIFITNFSASFLQYVNESKWTGYYTISDGARNICHSTQNLYITINEDCTNLPERIFTGLSTLRSLTLPFSGSGTKENTGSFASLFGTKENSNMKKVGSYYLPAELKEVTISEGCEQLPTGAFKNCSMIEKLTLPTTLKGVKEEALYGCDGLTDIYVKRALPPSAYESTFTGVNQFGCTLHVPHDSKKFYSVATGWKYFYFIEEEAPLTIHVTKNIENAGEILGLEQYQPGQTAELEAIAHSGYKFAAWTEEGLTISTESKLSLTVVDSRELIAVFVPVTNENAIGVNTGKGKAVFTWEQEEGAERYVLNVYADEGKTILVHSSTFDANGTVVTRSGVNFTAEVTGLNEEESYYYDITAYAEENVVLSQYTGTFTVLANGIAVSPDSRIMCRPVRGGLCIENATGMPVRIFNLKGQAVYSQSTGSNRNVIALPSGMYIVRIGELTQKCAVH